MGNQEEKLTTGKFLKDLKEIVKNAPEEISFFIAVKLDAVNENGESDGILAVKGSIISLSEIFANAIDSDANAFIPIKMGMNLSKKSRKFSIVEEIFRK